MRAPASLRDCLQVFVVSYDRVYADAHVTAGPPAVGGRLECAKSTLRLVEDYVCAFLYRPERPARPLR